jgi:hypothetical protein
MPVLASTIRIAGANQTSAVSPANLQMTQANLACAIGVPQQNIQIRNVTVVYTNGTRKVLPFDPAVTQLNSGSDVVCLAPTTRTNTTTTVARRLKQVTYTIEITYDIVDPPLVVLSMDGATFMASLEKAPPELALGIGAAAVTTASSAPVTITSSSTNISQGPLLYGVIGAIVGAIVVLGVGVGFIIIRLQQRLPTSVATPPQKTTETKIVYVVENPMQGPAPKEEDAAARNNYNPVGVRRI